MTFGNEKRQLVNDTLAPNGLLELVADVSSHFPVKIDQACVHRLLNGKLALRALHCKLNSSTWTWESITIVDICRFLYQHEMHEPRV
jgi:hypothetical protein